MALTNVADILGGENVLQHPLHNRLDLITLTQKGVTKEALLHLARFLACSLHDLAELLPVTERTLQRYAPGQPLESSRLGAHFTTCRSRCQRRRSVWRERIFVSLAAPS